jgi:hypothetical protein
MGSKGRIVDTLLHKQPDKIPVDFGGTSVSGMHVTCVAALREYYGLKRELVKVYEPYQMLGLIENDLKEAIGVDVESVGPYNNLFGFPNENWKEWRLDNGLLVLVPGKFMITENPNGDKYIYPEGDLSAKPSGHMPKGGFYFDSIIRQVQINDEELDPEDNLEEFKYINQSDLDYYKANLETAASKGRAVSVNFGGTALGDIALVPAPFLKHPKGIRDVEEWYISTITRCDYIHEVFEKQTDIALENIRRFNSAMGDLVDIIFICGADFGTQNSTFCSENTFSELYMPYYKKINDWIHKNTAWKTFKHSCGAIEPFMKLFIEAGFDIINPVQCSAKGMDPKVLKDRYGDKLVFWGGGVDTQWVLPFGTIEEIKLQVLERCKIFSQNGGFVFTAIHNVQANTPVENIAAMIEAIKEFNGIEGK